MRRRAAHRCAGTGPTTRVEPGSPTTVAHGAAGTVVGVLQVNGGSHGCAGATPTRRLLLRARLDCRGRESALVAYVLFLHVSRLYPVVALPQVGSGVDGERAGRYYCASCGNLPSYD